MSRDLIIDPEFKALIPKLADAELEQLERSLRANGCLDPIRVWSGHNVIIDGHNRYEICTRRNIEFEVVEIYLSDKEMVKDWMIRNQLGRRNLSPDAASLLRAMLYNARKHTNIERASEGGKAKSANCQNGSKQTTAATVAAETGVSERTVLRDTKFLAEAEEAGMKDEVLAGKAKKKDVKAKAKPEPILAPEPEPFDLDEACERITKSLQKALDKVPVTEHAQLRAKLIEFLKGK